MTGIFPEEFIEEVRERTDIVLLVSEYLQLKRTGRNYLGLCPFHAEKTPSFNVSPEKQFFYCFGCGEGGSVFNFVMKMEGLTFPEAVVRLAEKAGLPVPETRRSPKDERRQTLLAAVDKSAKYYQHMLWHAQVGQKARDYLQRRGLSEETCKRFGLGFAPDSWEGLKNFLSKRNFRIPELLAAGLLNESEKGKVYDRFRNRIIFTICNSRGEPVGFGARVLDSSLPKYINSPETPLFDKGKNLYALHLARETIRKEKKAILFEGYMDVIVAHQAGFTNAVATLGTALTEAQARLLRNQADEVILVYDADAAGQAATWRGLQVLRQAGCLVKVGRLPAGMDPDDFIRQKGAEAFSRILAESLLLFDYQLTTLAEQHDLATTEGRLRFTEKVLDLLAGIDQAVEREEYLKKAADLLKVPVETLRSDLRKSFSQVRARNKPQELQRGRRAEPATTAESAALQILAIYSQHPGLAKSFLAEITEADFPRAVREAYRQVSAGSETGLAGLADLIEDEKYRRMLGSMIFREGYERETAEKALEDCVRFLKRLRYARERKDIELQMSKLDPVAAKGELGELSRKWLELRRLEDALKGPREGGKDVG